MSRTERREGTSPEYSTRPYDTVGSDEGVLDSAYGTFASLRNGRSASDTHNTCPAFVEGLDKHVRVKERESGYPESEHILALSANAFVGGDYLEALREDIAIQMAVGRKDIPDPTMAGDFCRRFSLGHILQMNKALREIQQSVYKNRTGVTEWTIDVDTKVHEVYGQKKEGASRNYNGVYSLQPLYAFVDETDELIHTELRAGNTHPCAKVVEYAEVSYQPVGWPKAYRYLIKRKREKNTTGQRSFFESLAYSCYAVVTNRTGNIQTLMKVHAKRGTCEKRICQFTNEFLRHLPMGGVFANWHICCARSWPTTYRTGYGI